MNNKDKENSFYYGYSHINNMVISPEIPRDLLNYYFSAMEQGIVFIDNLKLKCKILEFIRDNKIDSEDYNSVYDFYIAYDNKNLYVTENDKENNIYEDIKFKSESDAILICKNFEDDLIYYFNNK